MYNESIQRKNITFSNIQNKIGIIPISTSFYDYVL